MKYYGFKNTSFGNAYIGIKPNRKRNYYDSLVRAGKKHARQEGKKQGTVIE